MFQYFKNVWAEMKLVTWPNADQTTKESTAVMMISFVFGGLLGGLDFVLQQLISLLLSIK